MRHRARYNVMIFGFAISLGVSADTQLTDMLQRLMTVDIKPGIGFTAELRVPPVELYDPLVMHEHDGAVWLNNDGKVEGDTGSRMLAIDPSGKVTVLVDADKMKPISAGFDIAPTDFRAFDGQLFVVDVGSFEIPVPQGQALAPDGNVYRVTPNGELVVVASGLINPWGIRFIGDRLWVSDINGDFIYGKRELPDGFIVEIEPK